MKKSAGYPIVFAIGFMLGVVLTLVMQTLGIVPDAVTILGVRYRLPVSTSSPFQKDFQELTDPAPTEAVLLRHVCKSTYTVIANRPLDIYFGAWASRGAERAQENSRLLQAEVSLDGIPLQGRQQDIVADLPIMCGKDYEVSFWVYYLVSIPDGLSPGEHEVKVKISSTEQVIDGHDNNGDGQDDFFGPGTIDEHVYALISKQP